MAEHNNVMPESRTYEQRCAKDPLYKQKMVERVNNTRRKNKTLLLEHFGNRCCKCGYDKCTAALEFHHTEPDGKEPKVIGSTKSLKRQIEEASKCILVCANCHREIHSEMEKYHK